MAELVLAIDQGTTGTTVLVLNRAGRIRGRAYGEIKQFYPQPGWVEHDPEEIYRSAVALSRKALRAARAGAGDLRAVGITNQRETFVVWERKSGRPVHRAIVWQCRRSAAICDALREFEPEVTRRTGLLLDPYFSGSKLKWLLDARPELRKRAAHGELCFGTIDSWLVFKLSGGAAHVTDYTNASRTLLLNLESREWDDWMLERMGVPREMLPTAVSSRGPLAQARAGTIASAAVPIGASIGDQQSALFGQGAFRRGEAKSTYGTGAFLLMNTGQERKISRNRLLATSALDAAGEPAYALEGSVFVAGAAIQWLRDEVGLLKRSGDSFAMARKSTDSGVFMVPAFVGLGAPYWDPQARGAIVGITRGTNRNDLVRAALESIAWQVRDVLVAMEKDTGGQLSELRVDGGASANDHLMQFQADILERHVSRPAMTETTALGAAALAGMAVGMWKSGDEAIGHVKRKVFVPRMKNDERERLLAGWQAAVRAVLGHTTNRPAAS